MSIRSLCADDDVHVHVLELQSPCFTADDNTIFSYKPVNMVYPRVESVSAQRGFKGSKRP